MPQNFQAGSLADWETSLRPLNPQLANELTEEPDLYQRVRQLGLPVPLYEGVTWARYRSNTRIF